MKLLVGLISMHFLGVRCAWIKFTLLTYL